MKPTKKAVKNAARAINETLLDYKHVMPLAKKQTTNFLSVDPGVWSAFVLWEDGVPVGCGYGPYEKVVALIGDLVDCQTLVIEKISNTAPRQMQGGVLKCADAAARIREAAARAGMDVIEVPPKVWKWQVFSLRGARKPSATNVAVRLMAEGVAEDMIKRIVLPQPRCRKPNQNILDATGIGLWWLAQERQRQCRKTE